MEAAGGRRAAGDGCGAPRLLEHCAALERMTGAGEASARVRVETLLGDELAGLLYRALTRGPQPLTIFLAY